MNSLHTRIHTVCLALLTAVICFSSCTRNTGLDTVTLPVDSALTDADRFAVITETYISLKDSPGTQGIIINHARRGEIYEVLGTKFVSKNTHSELWVQLTGGWLLRSSVDLYSNKEKALTAVAQLKTPATP